MEVVWKPTGQSASAQHSLGQGVVVVGATVVVVGAAVVVVGAAVVVVEIVVVVLPWHSPLMHSSPA